jgi:ribosomal protein L40E
MISPFRMNLKPEWLPALSNLATLAPGVLCAWQGLDSPPLPEDARQVLLGEELFDPSGAATPSLLTVINLLSAPSASLQLQLNNSDKSFDYRVFFSMLEGESASLLQNGNGLVLTAPARPNDLLTSLRQHTGDSQLQPVSFSADLPLTEALALAALLDRYRDFIIHSIVKDSKMITPTLSPVAVAEVVAGETHTPQWMTAVIRNAAGLSTTPDEEHFAAALGSLSNRSLVTLTTSGEGYALPESVTPLAEHLLLIDNYVQMTARRANLDGDINQASFIFLQSGVSNLMRIEMTAGLVRLESISAATLLDQVEYYLTRPDALPLPPPRPVIWKLALVSGGTITQEYELMGPVKIGRGSDCEIQIADPRSSRHQAIIRLVEGGYEVQDLGSTNGTYLNHIQLLSPTRLQDGDLIRIGETYLKVIGSRSASATAPTPRRLPAEPQPSVPDKAEVEIGSKAEPLGLAEEPQLELSNIELPAWLRTPPGEMPENLAEEPEAEAQLETPESEPPVEPLAWLHTAEEAQAVAEPPAPDELLAAPPADLEPPLEEIEGELPTSISPEPAAEEPILGETRPTLAEPEPDAPVEPVEPTEEPLDEPITGETRKIASGRSHTQQICSHCGNSSPLSARFCGVCGNQLRD